MKLWLLGVAAAYLGAMPPEALVQRLQVPQGFRLELFTGEAPQARGLCLGDKGTVFCGSKDVGQVYAFRDENGDGYAERRWVVAQGLVRPVGVDFKNKDLYVSSQDRVVRLRGIEERLDHPGEPELFAHLWPNKAWHGWKFIKFGPDGLLYVPVGAPCNVCEEGEPFASITRVEDGRAVVVARGVRNSVGFDWHPQTKELWFTDNGRDWMGDDRPPCELNRLSRPGQHFGFPYLHGRNILDPQLGVKAGDRSFVPPVWEFGAHNAPLGMRFYRGRVFPPPYRGNIFVALHGSWNRSRKDGYRVARLVLRGNQVLREETFVWGFLDGQRTLGRPADVQDLPDGSLLVSDDHAGAIYRVRWQP